MPAAPPRAVLSPAFRLVFPLEIADPLDAAPEVDVLATGRSD